MRENEVNTPGLLAAAFLALVGTIGFFLTNERMPEWVNWLWLGTFTAALLTLSGAVVNFDPKRIIK